MTFSKTLLAGATALLLSMPVAYASDSNHSGHEHGTKKESHSDHGDHKNHGLKVTAAWTRATVKTAKVGGGYITIKNNTDHADRLIGGSAVFAGDVQLHTMTVVDDVARMRVLPNGIEVPAGGEVTLKPGGDHVMFMGLTEQLKEGEKRTVKLTFEKAGVIEVSFKVNGLAAKGSGHDHSGHGDSHGSKKKGHGDHDSSHDDHAKHGEKKKDDHDDHSKHSH